MGRRCRPRQADVPLRCTTTRKSTPSTRSCSPCRRMIRRPQGRRNRNNPTHEHEIPGAGARPLFLRHRDCRHNGRTLAPRVSPCSSVDRFTSFCWLC
jgi:hypothetical protein